MPEKNQERIIEGKTTIASSSDEANIATLREQIKENYGLNGRVIDTEAYPPISVTHETKKDLNQKASGETSLKMLNLTSNDSGLGDVIRRRRVSRLRRAA